MAIVSSTALFKIKEQDLNKLKDSHHIHSSNKRLRRQRKNTAFHNVIFKYPKAKIVFLIYQSGKVVVLGSRNEQELAESASWLSNILSSPIIDPPVISNYVYTYASGMLFTGRGDTLTLLYTKMQILNEKRHRFFGHLEPELSPALIYHPECNANAKAMMFRSGKVTITGLRTEEDIMRVREEIENIFAA